MAWGRLTILPAGLAFVGALFAGRVACGSETKQQLLEEIQKENNPVKKAKTEIKLSRLEFSEVHEAYLQGHFEDGVKLLNKYVDTLEDSWKTLQASGRRASKQPQGFRELEIALREDERALEDLERSVDYFNRPPLDNAAKQLEQTHGQVMQELFPGSPPKPRKGQRPAPAANPGAPA